MFRSSSYTVNFSNTLQYLHIAIRTLFIQNTEITGVDGVSGLVNYTVNISSIPELVTVSHAQCVGGQYSYLFRATGLLLPSSLSVSVTAFNAIGTGPPSSPLAVGKLFAF